NVDEKEGGEMGSLETRTDKMQTLIPTPPRSPRTILSLDKNLTQELTAATIIEDRDAFSSKVPDLVSQEFNAQAPKIIEEIFKNYIQSNVIQVYPTTITSTKTTSSADLEQQLYFKMKRKETFIDEYEVIPKDETPELITELQDADKHVKTIFDALSNQFKNAEEYAYHLEQTMNFMENQIV
nr:hypothetical protein [Tanacetum cinerariifolium]